MKNYSGFLSSRNGTFYVKKSENKNRVEDIFRWASLFLCEAFSICFPLSNPFLHPIPLHWSDFR